MTENNTRAGDHIRPIEPRDDMAAVLDLIELGFKNELGPQGWTMLKEMRRLVYQDGLIGFLTGASLTTHGFVWVEDDAIVGNLSLRRAVPYHTRGRLIGNVVVHPDYRSRGIGRALMERAIAAAQEQSSRWIGLEVRADNAVACGLYRRLGFQTVGQTQHLLRPENLAWPSPRNTSISWRRSRPKDSSAWLSLAQLMHGPMQRRVLEIRESIYKFGGLQRNLEFWLKRQREQAWMSGSRTMPHLALRIKTDRRNHFHLWDALLDPREGKPGAEAIVAQAVARTERHREWPVVATIPDYPPLLAALRTEGFEIHRTLQQMILKF